MQLRAFKSASTFDGVASLYQTLPEWRAGSAYGTRDGERSLPLARSLSPYGKRYVTLRPIASGYAARYHDTDVVTWTRRRLDTGPSIDFVVVTGWSSLSTETFADAFTPWNLRFKLHLNDGYFVRVDDNDTARCYEFDSTIEFEIKGSMGVPYEHKTKTSFVDIKSPMLRVALNRTRYQDFMAYARARMALHQGPIAKMMLHPHGLSLNSTSETLSLLDDPNKWHELLFAPCFANIRNINSTTAWLDDVSDHIRACVYKHFKAVPVRKVEWYPWSQFEAQRRLRAKYPWAVY